MIKLTKLHFKVKAEALERQHVINEYAEEKMFEWEQGNEKASNLGGEYNHKPYIEPFDFKEKDFIIKEVPFRCPLDAISYYGLNEDNDLEVLLYETHLITVKEKIEDLDQLFGI
jgi:hypothetical protein